MADAKLLQQIDERIRETEDEIQELALDDLKITKITPDIKARLEKMEDLIALSMNKCELESLENFPNNAGLIRLEICGNKFKPTELTKLVDKLPKLQILMLSDNSISDFKEIQPLSGLKELVQLDMLNTPLSKNPNYRKKLFELIPSLEVLDDLDREGNPYEGDEDDEDDEDGDEEDEEEDYDDEDDDDEEYGSKQNKRKKQKK